MNSLYGVHKRMVATALQPNLPGTSRNPNTTSTANAAQSWNPGTQPTVVESQRISDLQEQFQQQAQKDPAGFRLALREAFGDKADLSQLDLLLDLALAGKLPMPANIRFVEAGSLGSNAFGAYDSSNGGSLYLDRSLLSDPAKLQSVFNEEMGHHLDALLGGADAAGDEGEVFSRTLEQGQLSQSELASLKNENDHGVIQLEGRWVQVEFNEEDSDDGGDGGDGGGGGECSVGGEGNAGAGGSQTSDNEDGGTGGTGGECNVDGPPSGGDGPPGGDNRDDEKDDKPSSGNGPQGGDGPPGVDNGDDDSDEMQTGDGFDNEAASEAMGDVQTGFDALGDTQEELGDLPNDPIPDDRTGFAKAARGLGFMAGTLSSLFDFRDGYQDRKKEGGSTSDAIFAGTASVVKTVDDIAVSAAGGWAGAARGGAYGASAGAATGTPHGTAIGGAIGTVGGGLVGGYVAGAAYDDSPIDEAIDADVDAKFDRIAENFNAGYDEGKAE